MKKNVSTLKIDPQLASRFGYYAFLIILVIVEIGAMIQFIPGLIKSINENNSKISQITETNKKLRQSEANLSQMNAASLKSDLAKASAALPTEKKISGLVTGLTTLASSSGVIVTALEFSPGAISTKSSQVKLTGVQSIPANLSIAGGINSILDFFAKLYLVSQLTTVNGISFGSGTSGSSGATFPVVIYYQPANSNPIDYQKIELLTSEEQDIISKLTAKDVFVIPPN